MRNLNAGSDTGSGADMQADKQADISQAGQHLEVACTISTVHVADVQPGQPGDTSLPHGGSRLDPDPDPNMDVDVDPHPHSHSWAGNNVGGLVLMVASFLTGSACCCSETKPARRCCSGHSFAGVVVDELKMRCGGGRGGRGLEGVWHTASSISIQ